MADATNLRVALRLVIELKRVGRPLMLVLNMIDIARRRGIDIDLDRLSGELGAPVACRPSISAAAETGEMGRSATGAAVDRSAPADAGDWRAVAVRLPVPVEAEGLGRELMR